MEEEMKSQMEQAAEAVPDEQTMKLILITQVAIVGIALLLEFRKIGSEQRAVNKVRKKAVKKEMKRRAKIQKREDKRNAR